MSCRPAMQLSHHKESRCHPFRLVVLAVVIALLPAAASPTRAGFPGLEEPGLTPVRFEPDILTAEYQPHGRLTFSPNQRRLYWSAFPAEGGETILTATLKRGVVLKLREAPFAQGEGTLDGGPAFSDDGQRLFFNSDRPLPEQTVRPPQAIWYVDKTSTGWGEPSPVVSTADPDWLRGGSSVSRDGTLYFQGRPIAGGSYSAPPRLYRSRLVDGEYGPPELLRGRMRRVEAVDPFIDPDERFMLFAAPGRYGVMDLYVSFRKANGSWARPINLATRTGTDPDFFDRFPSLSRDGKYLFFVRAIGDFFPGDDAHFYWVSSEALKPRKRPKNLRVTAAAGGLAIRWKDRSKDELEFHLERSAGGAGWTRIATLPRNGRRHTDTDVSVGTQYCYRVRAANFGGTSEPSNQSCRTP